MHNKILLTSLLITLSVVFSAQSFAAGSCLIESGPIPELARYSREVDTQIAALMVSGRSTGVCGITRAGASVGVERTADIISSATTGFAYFPSLVLDASYNIGVAINGETRAAVVRDGQIFAQVDQRITQAIQNVSNQCHLSVAVKSGFVALLRENNTLENIYKQSAIGTPVSNLSGLSPGGTLVAQAISNATTGYLPTATEACKPPNSGGVGDGISDIIAKSLQQIELSGTRSQGVLTDWNKAIALFQGGGGKMTISEYTATQRRLLQAELSRQGFSPRSAQAILSSFDCFKGKTQGDSSAEAAVRARQSCLQYPILGLENILLPWRQLVDSAQTTTDRSNYVGKLQKEDTLKKSIVATANTLASYRTPAIDTKSALMSNLIDIHLGLLSTSEQVEKRAKIMYTNCMKAQPDVPCPRP